ncbi:hypothetical protein C8Q72DRAFT_886107 [Fomitopsis betulina]|nr:hypothetical protein C8Q72DRAFT_886107 [Fomitopsis betulina]
MNSIAPGSITTLDVVRAQMFVAEILGDQALAPSINVPVIVPLFSQSLHALPAGYTTTDGAGSATLSMAYESTEFAGKVLRALKDEAGIIAPSFPEGVARIHPLGKLTDSEKGLVDAAVPELALSIEKGVTSIESESKL